MWPCGTIVLLGELFPAESKSQVYAIVHEFLSKHTNLLDDLSKSKLDVLQILLLIHPPKTLLHTWKLYG